MLLDTSKPEDCILAAALRGPDKDDTVGALLKEALTAPFRALVGVDSEYCSVGYAFWRDPWAPRTIVAMMEDISQGDYGHYLAHLALAYEVLGNLQPLSPSRTLARYLGDLARALALASAGSAPELVLQRCAAVAQAVRELDGDQSSES